MQYRDPVRRIITMLTTVAIAVPVRAAITNVTIGEVTNTQAILTYIAPDANACRVEVSEFPELKPLVYDVDPVKFSGADQDVRSGSIVDGQKRTFVIGKRMAEKAAHGKRYSRALQSLTDHYYRISYGSDRVTGELQTHIAFGNTFSDPPPVNEEGGDFAWPTLDPTNRNQTIIDPQTGALIRRVSLPSDREITQNNEALTVAPGTTWSSEPWRPLNGDGNSSATISGDTHRALFLTLPPSSRLSFGVNGVASNSSINYYQVLIAARIDRTECNYEKADDRKIVVCLTVDGVNCRSGGSPFERPLTTRFEKMNSEQRTCSTPGNPLVMHPSTGSRPDSEGRGKVRRQHQDSTRMGDTVQHRMGAGE